VLPVRTNAGGVDAEFRLIPLRLEAGIEPIAGPRLALQTVLVGGVGIVSLAPQSAPALVQVEATSPRVQPILGPAVAGRFRLSPSADLVLTTGLDVDLSPRRWVVASPPERDALFETARVRPYAALGVDFTMLGARLAST